MVRTFTDGVFARVPDASVLVFLVLLWVSPYYWGVFSACSGGLGGGGVGLWVCMCAESLTAFLSEASPTPDSFTSPISPPSPPWQPVSSCEYLCAFVHFFKAHLVAKARLLSASACLLVSSCHRLCRKIRISKLPDFFTFTNIHKF